MKPRKDILILALIFCFYGSFKSQEIPTLHFSNKYITGLTSVEQIVHDSKGYYWISGEKNELLRFDGIKWLNLSDSLPPNFVIQHITESSDSTLWFFGKDGTRLEYNGLGFNTVNILNKVEGQITCSFRSLDGSKFFGTSGHGVILEKDKIIYDEFSEEFNHKTITAFSEDSEGNLWIGSNKGLYMDAGNELVKFKLPDSLNNGFIDFVIPYESNSQLIGINNRYLMVINNQKSELLFGFKSNSKKLSKRLKAINNGNSIFIGHTTGLYVLLEGQLEKLNYQNGITVQDISTLSSDSHGIIWVGSRSGEIIAFNGINSMIIKQINDQNLQLSGLYKSTDSFIKVVTKKGDIYSKGNEFHLQKSNSPDIGNNVISLSVKDDVGSIWLCTNNSRLYGQKGNDWINIDLRNPDKSEQEITSFFVKHNLIYYGTKSGELYKHSISTKSTEPITRFDSPVSFIRQWNDQIYIGTKGSGLFMLNNKVVFPVVSLSGQFIYDLLIVQNGVLAATNCNINHVVNGKVHCKLRNSKTECFPFYALSETHDGQIYSAINNGLLELVTDFSSESCISVGKTINPYLGMKLSQSNASHFVIDKDNIAWVGSSTGLVKHSLNRALQQGSYMNTKIHKIHILGDNQNKLDQKGQLSSWIHLPADLELPYDHNSMQLGYIAYHPFNDNKMFYSTKLSGFETSWSVPDQLDRINYYNLKPGEYTFRVRAVDKNNNTLGPESSYSFKITPPFWKTMWFYSLIFVLIIAVLVAIVRLKEKSNIKVKLVLEEKIKESNQEILAEKEKTELQNTLIRKKNLQITQSLMYARNFQRAVLPSAKRINSVFSDFFVIYKPKDIVSGDFYYMKTSGDKVYFAVIDCTGHGVPGALMSLIGYHLIELQITGKKLTEPDKILNELDIQVERIFKKEHEKFQNKAGFDIGLGILDKHTGQLSFCGAHSPLVILRKGELLDFKGDNINIGLHSINNQTFTKHEIQLQTGDRLYLFSDGYYDQMGGPGPERRKFMKRNFKNLLLANFELSLADQKDILEQTFDEWKGDHNQLDDVLVWALMY